MSMQKPFAITLDPGSSLAKKPPGAVMAAEGRLEVPMARTYPLERALDAMELLRGRHPGGKVALLPRG